jgi:hypothetical protein
MLTPDPAYPKLLKSVTKVLAEGKQRAMQAVEHERVATYHAVGELIDRHILTNGSSPGYGDRLFETLATDLDISGRLLRDGHSLYRWHPTLHARAELGWTHYRILLRLPDAKDRNRFESKAARNHWPTRELEKQIRQVLPASGTPPAEPADHDLPR